MLGSSYFRDSETETDSKQGLEWNFSIKRKKKKKKKLPKTVIQEKIA